MVQGEGDDSLPAPSRRPSALPACAVSRDPRASRSVVLCNSRRPGAWPARGWSCDFGSLSILLLYALIISRIIKIGNITRSSFGKLYCYSFATAFFIYVAVNMMMVLGLLPIVGSPLPIMSYGGSSMLATMIGFGIVLSAKINHKQMIA